MFPFSVKGLVNDFVLVEKRAKFYFHVHKICTIPVSLYLFYKLQNILLFLKKTK